MEYDKYLEDSREARENMGDLPTKVWMVVFQNNGDEDFSEFSSQMEARLFYQYAKTPKELGWIWDRDICQDWRKYFNVIESYGS